MFFGDRRPRGLAFSGPGGGTVNCQFGAGPYEKLSICSCPTQDQINAVIDKFVRTFPQQATQINSNRQRIIDACCPPYISSPPPEAAAQPRSLIKIQARAEDLTACQTAILNVVLDSIGIVLSLVGLGFSTEVRQAVYRALPGSQLNLLRRELEQLRIAWNQGGLARARALLEVVQKPRTPPTCSPFVRRDLQRNALVPMDYRRREDDGNYCKLVRFGRSCFYCGGRAVLVQRGGPFRPH